MAERDRRKSGKANWLLIKRRDGTGEKGRSTANRAPRRRAAPDPGSAPGARRGALPKEPSPQLATPVTRVPEGPGWLFEPKLDGYRVLCRLEDGAATLLTRRGNDWTDRFARIAAAARELRCRAALIDGEAVVFDSRGVSSFQRLQNALSGGADAPIVLVAFDLLHLDGWDLTHVPLVERKALLEKLLDGAPDAIRYGEHFAEDGEKFFAAVCKLGLEGLVAKRADDPYRETRTRSWLKIKCGKREEFVVVGFTDRAGSLTGFGALLVATRERSGAPLRYAGKVGSGFDERTLRALHARLTSLETKTPPIEKSLTRGVHWVEPKLVAAIGYSGWTGDGRLRHPVYFGLREDKTEAEVTRERAAPPPEAARDAAPDPPRDGPRNDAKARSRVRLTHPDKVLFPDPGITKRELADYWAEVADVALPHLKRRPLTLYRCPDGYAAQCFYQKHAGAGVPAAVPRVTIREDEDPYAMIEDVASLQALAQIGVLELHVWGSRAEHFDRPDVVIFDLDPAEGVRWSEVVSAAFAAKERLERLGLAAFAKLTGGKGVHVVVPVKPGPTWPAVKKFARAFAIEMARDEPKRFVASMSKSKRVGKILIDYLRNDAEATAIGAYSPRARPGAPVALPIEWDELAPDARVPPKFGLRDVPKLIRARKRDPWRDFEAARRALVD